MSWKSRIVGSGLVDPSTLEAHPSNWHIHTGLQKEALTDLLNQVGWVQRVIVNKPTGRIVDGHLRAALAEERQEMVPVEYVELTEREEALALATFDPIKELAEKYDDAFSDLVRNLEIDPGPLKDALEIRTREREVESWDLDGDEEEELELDTGVASVAFQVAMNYKGGRKVMFHFQADFDEYQDWLQEIRMKTAFNDADGDREMLERLQLNAEPLSR